jgi:CubicO group peptidase (beta-lactamase class C family)
MKSLRVIVSLLSASVCFAQDTARMEQLIQAAVQARTFMGSVLVARGGEVVLSKGYGSANLEWDLPNTPTTKFRLGSVTKQFTAAAILLLEERGKLKLDDPVKKHMPDAPEAWDGITIHHLLTHTSGITNFTALPEYRKLQVFASPVAKTIESFKDKPLDFAPGERMSYSNSGYLVLGHLIEVLSGDSYAEFVQENIFTPLGMKDSGFDSNSEIIPRRAAGYSPGPKGPTNTGFIHMTIPHAAGALYSTTEDLLRWQQGLFAGKVVTPASLAKMTTPFKGDYGFGVNVRTVNGRKLVQHGGGIEGFNTALAYFPETRTTVVVLANLNGPVADQLCRNLGTLAHGETVTLNTERKEIKLPAATLSKYVGTYEMTPKMTMTVTLDGEQLMTQLTGQSPLKIFPESETAFFLKVVDAQLEFIKDQSGAVTHVVLHQGGRDLKGARR